MKQILFLVFLVPFFLYSYSRDKALEKLQAPPPDWMIEQIKQDFSYFSNGFSKTQIEETIHEVRGVPNANVIAHLVPFSIKDNIIYVQSQNFRALNLAKFLTDLAEITKLPDVDFLFSHSDCYEHPSFLWKTTVPVLAISKWQANNRSICIPDVGWIEHREKTIPQIRELSYKIEWDQKDEIAYWRGSTTDQPYLGHSWDYRPRARVVLFSKNYPDLVDAFFSRSAWLDKSMQSFLREEGYFSNWANFNAWLQHKYIFAIDGYAFPGSFFWGLLSNSVVLKHPTGYIEWYYNALKPFEHYIPYSEDLSDLGAVILWLRNHDDIAQQIAKNATNFCENNLMYEDIMLYYYLVLQEYARLETD